MHRSSFSVFDTKASSPSRPAMSNSSVSKEVKTLSTSVDTFLSTQELSMVRICNKCICNIYIYVHEVYQKKFRH